MDLKLEANKEHKRLVGEDDERWKNVDDKKSPEDMLNEIQMQKTHELYCPKCFHNITKTAKLFKKKREASSPYNEDKFTWWFVIVFSFNYPFIYLPWLYNNTSGASEPTHSVVAETPTKHILDWFWHPLVVVLVLLSAITFWVLFSPTIPPLPPPHTNGDATTVTPEAQKLQDVIDIHGYMKPHVSQMVEHISPSLPPPQLHTNVSSTILNQGPRNFTEDVPEIQGDLEPHVSDAVIEDRPIRLSPPPPHGPDIDGSLISEPKTFIKDVTKKQDHLKPDVVVDDIPIPPPLPSPPPHTDDGLIHVLNFLAENPLEIQGNLKPHGPDVVEDDKPVSPPIKNKGDVTEIKGRLKTQHVSDVDDIHVPPSPPPLIPQPHTNESLIPHTDESLIPAPNFPAKNVSEIQGNLKPHGPDVVQDDKNVSPSIKNKGDVTEIKGRLKPQHVSDVDDIPVPPSPPPLLPQPYTNESLTHAPNFPAEDVSEIQGNLKPHGPDVVEDDKPVLPPIKNKGGVTEIKGFLKTQHVSDVDDIPVPPSPPPLLPQLHTDDIFIPAPNFPAENVSEIQGLKPHGPYVVEDDKPVSPPINNKGDVTDIKGRLKPQYVSDVDDILVPPSPPLLLPKPHTDETLIPAPKFPAEDVSEIQGNLKPQGPDVVEDDKPFSPPIKNKGDDTDIKGRLKPQHVSDVDDIPVPPSPPLLLPKPYTDETLIPASNFPAEDVSEIQGNLKPHGPYVVEDGKPVSPSIKNKGDVTDIKGLLKPQHVSEVDDILVPPSPPLLLPKPHTDETLIPAPNFPAEDVSEIQGNLKPQGPDVVEDDKPFSPPIKNKGDVTDIKGRLKPQHVSDVDDIPVPPSPPLLLPKPYTDETLIPAPKFPAEDVSEIQGNLKPQGPDVVDDDKPVLPPIKNKGDVTEIKGRLKPQHVSDVDDIHVPPSLPPLLPQPHTNESLISAPNFSVEDVSEIQGNLKPHGSDVSPPIKNKGGCWVPFSWDKNFPSNMVLLLISLLLSLAILTLCWSFISRTKGTKPESIANLPNMEILQNGEAQISTSKPEDKKEVLEGLSTPGNKTNGRSDTETKISPPFLWKHIVVLAQIVLQTELDILKSIVYGGLIESITSFGVVSSASASGTSTLHVISLGLANLFSGLCIIIYNLYGLVTSKPIYPYAKIGHMTDEKATDPYEELLGNRNNVILHCIVVVVSFIFFGVIPPLLYGFSYKITDNGRHYEAAVVIAASLVCVTSLSFAKAYAFGMDKIKTVAVYTGIAIGGFAFSLIATQYVRDLLEMNEFLKLASDYP